MDIYINGVEKKIDLNKKEVRISDIISFLPHSQSRVSIFLNGVLVQKAEWDSTNLKDQDQVESVQLIAGG